jgi:PAS domain S-box-containing protein
MGHNQSKKALKLKVIMPKNKEILQENERRFKELAEFLPQTVYEMDLNGTLTFVNKKAYDHFGYSLEDFKRGASAFDMIVPEDHKRAVSNISKLFSGEKIGSNKYTALRKDKSTFPAKFYSEGIFRNGQPVGARGFIIDITEQVELEDELRKSRDELERRVKERTSKLSEANKILRAEISEPKRIEKELIAKEKELRNKNAELQELNTALRVLLKKGDRDKDYIEQKIINNINEMVLPYLEKLKDENDKSKHAVYLNIIKLNLDNILSHFGTNIKIKYYKFTPSEIQIADLIRNGKTTTEISSLLDLSPRTIEFHRDNIRTKLQIKNKKINLRSKLLSLK